MRGAPGDSSSTVDSIPTGVRPGPELVREHRRENRPIGDGRADVADVMPVDDQGVVRRPPLGFKDAIDRAGIRRVGTEAIYSLGREGDEAAVADDGRSLVDRGR